MDYDKYGMGRLWGCLGVFIVIALLYLIGVYGLK